MKKFILPTILITLVFLLSNFTIKDVSNTSNFIFTILNESPNLPDSPFDYTEITFPDHLTRPDPDPVGYERGFINTNAFEFIDNDIATLGRVLFYDKKLSAMEDISCGSCHNQSESFAENKPLSEGVQALTKRNSMHLNDLGWTNNSHFLWDLRETDLKKMIRLPLLDENEIGANMDDVVFKLNDTEYYPELFTNAFGDSNINEERIIIALENFIGSMVTFNSRFDEQANAEFIDFNEKELLGLELFSVNCASCHVEGKPDPFGFFIGGPDVEVDSVMIEEFANMDILEFFPFMFNNGLPATDDDLGAGEWSDNFNHLFKVPTLRNIALTGPYMHDGRFETLEEVIDFYSTDPEPGEWDFGFIPPGGFGFSEEEKDALIEFMKTLTDESFLTNEIWSDPFDLSSSTKDDYTIKNVVVSPNPMGEYANIKFDNPTNLETEIKLYAPDGSLLSTNKITGNNYRLSKADFSSGMYMLRITQGKKVSTQKIIVK